MTTLSERVTNRFALLLLTGSMVFANTPSHAQGGPAACCIPIAVAAITVDIDIAGFYCCCPYEPCSELIPVSGGYARYGAYLAIYDCADEETCKLFQEIYDEIEEETGGHPGNFPPIPCGETGPTYHFEEWADPNIWADGDQICEACCFAEGCLPVPPDPPEDYGEMPCLCCEE